VSIWKKALNLDPSNEEIKMNLTLFRNHWHPLFDFENEVNHFLDNTRLGDGKKQNEFRPACDVEEGKDHYLLSFDLPGVPKDQIGIRKFTPNGLATEKFGDVSDYLSLLQGVTRYYHATLPAAPWFKGEGSYIVGDITSSENLTTIPDATHELALGILSIAGVPPLFSPT